MQLSLFFYVETIWFLFKLVGALPEENELAILGAF